MTMASTWTRWRGCRGTAAADLSKRRQLPHHVMDLAVADRQHGDTRTTMRSEPRLDGCRKDRSASGEQYVFTGVVSAMCGAYDDVVLPKGTSKNDFRA